MMMSHAFEWYWSDGQAEIPQKDRFMLIICSINVELKLEMITFVSPVRIHVNLARER